MLSLQNNSWTRILFQLIGTTLILVLVPSDIIKLFLFLLFWLAMFYPLNKKEIVAFILISVAMTLNDIATVANGVFFFTTTTFFGIPYFQTVLWAFYFLHWTRVYMKADFHISQKRLFPALALLILLLGTLYFAGTHDIRLFFLSILFVITIFFYHTYNDWCMFFYGVFTGLVIEIAGTQSGQWYYTGEFLRILNIPYWIFLVWALASWLVGQILLPLLQPQKK